MKERERVVVSGVVAVLVLGWLGFLVHQSPRFPGSAVGAIFGIAGAVVMLAPLVYVAAKRLPFVRTRLGRRIKLRTLLSWHIYTGIAGPLLALTHTGHKFDSALGIWLTGAMLLVVVTGFVGRYLLSYVSGELHDKTSLLVELRMQLARARASLSPQVSSELGRTSILRAGLLPRLFAGALVREDPAIRVLHITESMADVEFALRTHERLKRWFDRWLKVHVLLSVLLYVFLALHVWSELYFGLRWLR
jgi:hypothetical protein